MKRTIRRSQAVMPFGPGAIYSFGNESFIALDSASWSSQQNCEIRLQRLEAVLRVGSFKRPPVPRRNGHDGRHDSSEKDWSVPFMRFPAWHFCPNCRAMDRLTGERGSQALKNKIPVCRHCRSKLAPMRFIAVCRNGHVMDVPWSHWAHSADRNLPRCENPLLKFISDSAAGGALQSLSVQCVCGARRNFHGLTGPEALRAVRGDCSGKHPWQKREHAETCDAVPQVVQRGDSNVWFPSVVSALDISASEEAAPNDIWAKMLAVVTEQILAAMRKDIDVARRRAPMIADFAGLTVDEIINYLHPDQDANADQAQTDGNYGENPNQYLKSEEWAVITGPTAVNQSRSFHVEKVDFTDFLRNLSKQELPLWSEFRRLIKDVYLARRIRIVKALTGFSRLGHDERKLSPDLTGRSDWLPATEVYGEGIFLEFSADAIRSWISRIPHALRTLMTDRQQQTGFGRSLPKADPDFVLLHTFSHLLARQLAFECGYSASSLSERIYSGDGMAGILIYTASADSEGAMGGLVREGEADRIYGIIKTALYRGRWCSNDPICSELPYQGYAGLNRAACHACSLLAETSCEAANSLLDRGHIYGSESNGVSGYFSGFMAMMDDIA